MYPITTLVILLLSTGSGGRFDSPSVDDVLAEAAVAVIGDGVNAAAVAAAAAAADAAAGGAAVS